MAEPHYLIDTSAWVFATRRAPRPTIAGRIRALVEQDVAATCGLIELELLGGAAGETDFSQLRDGLEGLHHLPIEGGDWLAAARLAFDLRRASLMVPLTDTVLAALAIRLGAVLVHADRDFDAIDRHSPLRVESLVHLPTG